MANAPIFRYSRRLPVSEGVGSVPTSAVVKRFFTFKDPDVMGIWERILAFALPKNTAVVITLHSSGEINILPNVAGLLHLHGSPTDGLHLFGLKFYFGSNTICFPSASHFGSFTAVTDGGNWLKRVQVNLEYEGDIRVAVVALERCTVLEELEIGIYEAVLLRDQCSVNHGYIKVLMCPPNIDKQLNMAILRSEGLQRLMAIKIPKVTFIPYSRDGADTASTGPIPGGILETVVAKAMMTIGSTRSLKRASSVTIPSSKRIRTNEDTVASAQSMVSTQTTALDVSPCFFKLPAEIRNTIYEYILAVDGKVNPTNLRPPVTPGKASVLCLLSVSKQIHHEAKGIFYRDNAFVFYYPAQLITFLHFISRERTNMIRDVTLWHRDDSEGGLSIMSLQQLAGLRKLELVLEDSVVWPLTEYHSLRGVPELKSLVRNVVEFKLRNQWVDLSTYAWQCRNSPILPYIRQGQTRVKELEDMLKG
ncbi:hypothetical protein P154DRAFT_521444 [Amniculicola lignicola CBS 123094]|uniref:F-box domain-containing protein n=1 Tax=Amniculicola lignicola CBS 123094 TaxID=1392246 RepID=A0A6A5WJH2_9PLEO|nr:hypothetical protein P154DRAFT_521444 [Amniculicola lignicola CBS 123094]